MVFSSNFFLLYFLPLFILAYYAAPRSWKNAVILCFSLFFYAWGAPVFIFTLLAVVVIDFYLVKKMDEAKDAHKKIYVLASVLINVGLLAYFKYANFFVDNINELFAAIGWNTVPWMHIALPIGISFFTFESLTYTIDVYRGVHKPLRKISDYLLYIIMFPKLIAGPIVRFAEIAGQIDSREREQWETRDHVLTGLYRFIIGLSKKVLIANVMATEADRIFAIPSAELSMGMAWLGIIASSFQIYYDFSGYSDMALGIGRMMGFRFPENFNNPYISQSITEFWRRWHMTLGRWMRDYLYIPLGGNRVSKRRMYMNLWLVFLLSGLWHGAAWNFIIWGAFHGLFLILDRLFLLKLYARIGKVPSVLITYLIVLTGWVFFRAENLAQAAAYLRAMYTFNGVEETVYAGPELIFFMFLAVFFAFFGMWKGVEAWQDDLLNNESRPRSYKYLFIPMLILLVLCLAYTTGAHFNPFIYFRF
jgi:alginate O-acetyltransferase complex protein AlgI